MQQLSFARFLILTCSLFFLFSCKKQNSTGEESAASQEKKVQFYASPADFGTASGYVISSFTVNNVAYTPKTSPGTCTDNIQINGSGDYMTYKFVVHNYNSLDALMNGWPYGIETKTGVLYYSSLKPGCNTLQLRRENGYGYLVQVL